MKNFKEIAEKCLAGELSGTFVFQNGQTISSRKLQKFDTDVPYGDYPYYISHLCTLTNYGFGYNSNYNVIDFIPDKMTQKKIEIDIPEGKVPVMEQTENGVVITWKEKELTYNDISNHIWEKGIQIGVLTSTVVNENTNKFSKKVEALRKLTMIRNYFGKPNSYDRGYCISYSSSTNTFYVGNVNTIGIWPKDIIFAKQEHAGQAIKMLGDELKYLFEPW
jgi:hypothetical protein